MSTKTKKTTKRSSQESVENGIKVLRMALDKDMSLSAASRKFSYGRNYLSDMNGRIQENYRNKLITRETFLTFTKLYKEYKKR